MEVSKKLGAEINPTMFVSALSGRPYKHLMSDIANKKNIEGDQSKEYKSQVRMRAYNKFKNNQEEYLKCL